MFSVLGWLDSRLRARVRNSDILKETGEDLLLLMLNSQLEAFEVFGAGQTGRTI